ncbi:hypothetical protein, partial [Psychromonas algicola]|uniref:hypothetical protein n=1 Tax=Psychromonas algicola TaxID=2555642 RepID=UPI00141A075E
LMNTSIVVFDLINGESSAHSDRTFDPDVSYTIYIRVDSDEPVINLDDDNEWFGGEDLGSDDLIILVGDGSDVLARLSDPVTRVRYSGPGAGSGSATSSAPTAYLTRTYSSRRVSAFYINLSGVGVRQDRLGNKAQADLWTGQASGLFDSHTRTLSNIYLTTMPSGILTSQGLV